MQKKDPKGRFWRRILILLSIALLSTLGIWVFNKNKMETGGTWGGTWDVAYHYEHEEALQYTGTLQFSMSDEISGHLEIFAPKSNRAEHLTIDNLALSEDRTVIRGTIVHDQYRINGGFLTETFEFRFNGSQEFKGTGRCLEYCAEGTEEETIRWTGKK